MTSPKAGHKPIRTVHDLLTHTENERDSLRSQADALAGALEWAEQYIADDGRKPGRKLPANAALAEIRSALAAYRGQQP